MLQIVDAIRRYPLSLADLCTSAHDAISKIDDAKLHLLFSSDTI